MYLVHRSKSTTRNQLINGINIT